MAQEYVSRKVIQLEVLFAVLTVASCLTGSKMVDIHISNQHFYTPASAFCFIITFFLSNVVSHLAGQEEAERCIKQGAVAQVIATVLFFLVGLLPAQYTNVQDAYMKILGTSWILVVASLIAFIVSQFVQVSIFEMLRKAIKLGANLISVLVSQIIDTGIFTFIAFGLGQGMMFSRVGNKLLIHVFLTQYLIKVIVSTLISPLFSIAIARMKKD